MPQHGFLRNNFWREVPGSRIDDDDGGSRVSLELSLADAIRARGKTGDWGSEETEYDASFTYTVSINGSGFETTIVMENRGTTPWKKFQVLLHNYFSVRDGKALDGEACNVSGLGGYAFHDKVTGEKSVLPPLLGPDDRPPLVTVPTESVIDREYAPPPRDDRPRPDRQRRSVERPVAEGAGGGGRRARTRQRRDMESPSGYRDGHGGFRGRSVRRHDMRRAWIAVRRARAGGGEESKLHSNRSVSLKGKGRTLIVV